MDICQTTLDRFFKPTVSCPIPPDGGEGGHSFESIDSHMLRCTCRYTATKVNSPGVRVKGRIDSMSYAFQNILSGALSFLGAQLHQPEWRLARQIEVPARIASRRSISQLEPIPVPNPVPIPVPNWFFSISQLNFPSELLRSKLKERKLRTKTKNSII